MIKLRNQNNFLPKKSQGGFSTLEILIVLAIIAIMFGVVTAMKTPFRDRMQMRNSAIALQQDLRTAQLYAWNRRGGFGFYGVRFFANQGAGLLAPGEATRDGWKIIRFNGGPPLIFATATVIKSSVAADSPEILDKTYFTDNRISLAATSDFQTVEHPPVAPQLDAIVFGQDGRATRDGINLLNTGNPATDQDQIILTGYSGSYTITLTIDPQTGHVDVPEQVQ